MQGLFLYPIFIMRFSRWAFASFCAAAIAMLVLSLMPPTGIPSGLQFWDKAQHALGFAVLTLLGLMANLPVRWLYPGLVIWGASIEALQALTPYRQADTMDWLADTVGVLLGHSLYTMWTRRDKLKK